MKQKWISTLDSLPKKEKDYLTYDVRPNINSDDGKNFLEIATFVLSKERKGWVTQEIGEHLSPTQTTHWTEMPDINNDKLWTKCSEKMPKEDKEVYVHDGNLIQISFLDTRIIKGLDWHFNDIKQEYSITHWAELPDKPTES